MKNDTQLKVQAYLDNELGAGDARKVAQLISSDAQARELYGALKDTKEILAHNEPVVKLPESRDFFWSKIEREIAAAERAPQPAAARSWWMRLAAPVAGAVALFAVLLSVIDRDTGSPVSLSQSLSPAALPLHRMEQSPNVSTITFRSDTEGVTVVWLSSIQSIQ